MIELEFGAGKRGRQSAKDKKVIDAWRSLLDELNIRFDKNDQNLVAAWVRHTDDKHAILLTAMSDALGFNFTDVEIQRGIYHPQGHVDIEYAQRENTLRLRDILAGRASFPMRVTEFPVSPDAQEAQIKMIETMTALSKVLAEGGTIHVVPDDKPKRK